MDDAIEKWLREDVAAAADALDIDPDTGISAADIREHFALKRLKAASERCGGDAIDVTDG